MVVTSQTVLCGGGVWEWRWEFGGRYCMISRVRENAAAFDNRGL